MDLVKAIASVPTDFIVNISLMVIALSFVIIAIAIIIYLLKNRKSDEEKKIDHVLRHVDLIRGGKAGSKEENEPVQIPDLSIKEMLVKKFKPKLESQVGSTVKVVDLRAAEDSKTFVAAVEISGVKLSIVLDPSGKIIDYKKEK
jgi:hypothetical protein